MIVTKLQVEHVAKLAKLSFSEKKKEKMIQELNVILDYMKHLSTIDVSGVEPLMFISPESNQLREDVEKKGLSLLEALSNTPGSQERLFKVPKVIE